MCAVGRGGLVNYKIVFTKQALRDLQKLKIAKLSKKARILIDIIENNPFEPPYEKLLGDLNKKYSRRINIKHRIIYEIHEKEKTIKILNMWTHYE